MKEQIEHYTTLLNGKNNKYGRGVIYSAVSCFSCTYSNMLFAVVAYSRFCQEKNETHAGIRGRGCLGNCGKPLLVEPK